MRFALVPLNSYHKNTGFVHLINFPLFLFKFSHCQQWQNKMDRNYLIRVASQERNWTEIKSNATILIVKYFINYENSKPVQICTWNRNFIFLLLILLFYFLKVITFLFYMTSMNLLWTLRLLNFLTVIHKFKSYHKCINKVSYIY